MCWNRTGSLSHWTSVMWCRVDLECTCASKAMTGGGIKSENPAKAPDAKAGFLKDICAYFRDFLDTDFKRQSAPKRSITLKDPAGNLAGIDAAKYPELTNEIWKLLRKPIGDSLQFSLAVPRGRFRGRINRALITVIEKQAEVLTEDELRAIADRTSARARELKGTLENDPERYSETVIHVLKSDIVRVVAVPLLKRLEATLDQARGDAYEAIYNIEEELGERLIEAAREPIASAIAAALAENSFHELDQVLLDVVDPGPLKQKLLAYFDAFVTTDFFQELHALTSTLKLRENFETYLYLCELRFNRASYPLFYLPVSVELEERVFRIIADPHLYINKRAVDFAAQEIARETGTPNTVKVDERILYLEPEQNFATVMQGLLDRWCGDLALAPLDLSESHAQKSERSQITINNSLHFAAFDKSDEAMLNDYEELMGLLRTGEPIALDFSDIVLSFLSKDPVSIDKSIEQDWTNTPVDARLVFASPVPLNEEQRKILSALRNNACRFVAIEGPPGCGKSHTIVAIVFEAILTGKNVLVLSDKKEALDVVEDKLTKVLNSVRIGTDFQNPILRLGKAGNTYGKILSAHALDAIRTHHRASEARAKEAHREIATEEAKLKAEINISVAKGQAIKVPAIAALGRQEGELSYIRGLEGILADEVKLKAIEDATAVARWCTTQGEPVMRLMRATANQARLGDLAKILEMQPRLASVRPVKAADLTAIQFFVGFTPHHQEPLQAFIRQYHAAKKPIVGFLFTRTKARAIDQELGQKLPCRSAIEAHRNINILVRADAVLSSLRADFGKAGIGAERQHWAFQQIIDNVSAVRDGALDILARTIRLRDFIEKNKVLASDLGLDADNLDWATVMVTEDSMLARLSNFVAEFQAMKQRFLELPDFDYVGEKSRLESLHTQRLAHVIDERVVDFADEHRNLARSLRDIIRKRQRFPREAFEHLKKAFPCMIAGIRDYAEYVPLEQGLFDLVIIDEASQVSIAQAFPAFIRAKQLVVLGDHCQFSNVKTVNASGAINAKYTHDVIDNFRRALMPDADTLNRVKMFNIKVSVLDFVERIANYKALLKKHFRGYPELISFSSKTFYHGQLQAVKIRGNRIDDVIRFSTVEQDSRVEVIKNTNSLEAEAILKELRELAALEQPPSVGIITPHTEQQALLVQFINRQEDADQLNEALDLKIMTFDTCQGEERDVIIYSMVATTNADKLNYIFPKSLEEAAEVDHVLRLQRLNVGFSRAKERIHFFLSKPLEEFSGAIGKAVQHFKATLEREKVAPQAADTDPKSPMEKQVLAWIKQTHFAQQFGDSLEIDAGFPIGAYLRQLDPTYRHPNYQVDFLLRLSTETKNISIIIEYDGFKEHFTDLHEVDASNYGLYQKPEDIERQKVLEGYGYRFIRINRFNLGKNPVRTLDERLVRAAQDAVLAVKPHALVEKVREQATGLANGDMKQCSVCEQVKSIDEFRDMSLARGYGRKCRTCKTQNRRRRR
jgi:very-short-patch-repair endonuclease